MKLLPESFLGNYAQQEKSIFSFTVVRFYICVLLDNHFSDTIAQELHRNRKRGYEKNSQPLVFIGTLGANRTRDSRIRNPVLYPLSYEGNWLFSIRRNNT